MVDRSIVQGLIVDCTKGTSDLGGCTSFIRHMSVIRSCSRLQPLKLIVAPCAQLYRLERGMTVERYYEGSPPSIRAMYCEYMSFRNMASDMQNWRCNLMKSEIKSVCFANMKSAHSTGASYFRIFCRV